MPALADPFSWIYQKKILDKDRRWYEQNILGSGPFKFTGYQIGQSIKGVRNPDYYHKGLPYLDGFVGIYAPKQAVQIDAIRSDRAAIEFCGYPPSAVDQLSRNSATSSRCSNPTGTAAALSRSTIRESRLTMSVFVAR